MGTRNGGLTTNVTDRYYQTVPVMEVAAGVNWQRDRLTLQAGYELATWFNLGEGENIPQRVGRSDDLGLDGLFFRLIVGY